MSYQPPNSGQPPQSPYQPQQPSWGAAQPGQFQPGGAQPTHYGGQPPKKNRTCLILGLVFGGIGGFCGLCICGFGFMAFYTTPLDMGPQDRAILASAEDVSQFVDDFYPNTSKESYQKYKRFDGSIEISYEYDEPLNDDAPYISYTVSVASSENVGDEEFDTAWNAAQIGMKLGAGSGVTVSERNDIFSWGDRSRFGIVTYEGNPAGNLFVGRQGKYLVVFLLAGIYFEDDAIYDLLMPKLEQLDTYSPE